MENIQISFVILHYLAIEDTINCIESIEKSQTYNNYRVIVVDNGSKVESDIISLRKIEKQYSNVEVVVSKENCGFARGNNVGFSIAKNKHHSDFIVLLNNDTIIDQDNFCQIIIEKYNQYKFAVAGPLIYLNDGTINSSPMVPGKYILYRQRFAQMLLAWKYVLSFVDLDIKKKRNIGKTVKDKVPPYCLKDTLDYKLHGCCLIFSKKYTDYFDGLNPNTFLYLEEDILFVRLRNHGLHSLYTPDLKIRHLEDSATNKLGMKAAEKRRFIYKNMIHSYKALFDEIKCDDENIGRKNDCH